MRPTLGMGRSPDADDNLTFMKQIGVEGVLIGPPVDPEKGYYEYPVLMNMKAQIEGRGLKCEGTSLLPWGMCYKWMLGLPGRDEQIENLQKTLRNMGAAGIPFMVYNIKKNEWHDQSGKQHFVQVELINQSKTVHVRHPPLF